MMRRMALDVVNKMAAEGAKEVFSALIPGGKLIANLGGTAITAMSESLFGDLPIGHCPDGSY